ncbi:hypothetical protein NX059_003753 [Plenodomus lindquistii]|nr:hypothetical protein NX059_003753 [Plenodomus lindquistii]
MSDTGKVTTPTPGAAPQFSERELQLLGWAMQSLKSGPPEIDYEKLASFAGMGNPRSAGNAWAKIKNKLMTPADGSVPPTPKKAGGRKKVVKEDGEEDGEGTPKKVATPRKRAAKKQDVDGDASPKKKSRAKSAAKVESEEDEPVKAEPEEAEVDEV